jgi:hypothetical protein
MGFGTQLSNQGLLLPLPVLKMKADSLNKQFVELVKIGFLSLTENLLLFQPH